MNQRICTVDGCERHQKARGWCEKHYSRWQRHGDPLKSLRTFGLSARERFDQKHSIVGECWEWQGAKNKDGYGSFWSGRYIDDMPGRGPVMVLAHRWSYESFVGPIEDGLCVLHRCDNPPCVNPVHLFLGTQLDNVADCAAKGRRNQGRPARPKMTTWSLSFDRCRHCQTTERKHTALGLCESCYRKRRRAA